MFNNNSRTRFTNYLAKPAKASTPWVKSLYIDIEQINFEYTILQYKNDVPDVIYDSALGPVHLTLETCYSVKCVINQLTNAVSPIFYIVKKSDELNSNKIVLGSYYHDIKIHKKLAKLLKIDKHFQTSARDDYLVLVKDQQYISYESIELNSFDASYVDIICEEIEPYFCDSEFKKIVARIDVAGKHGQTIHTDTLLRRFYKIKTSVLESITFEIRHPDGRRLLMYDGPPTIIKAKIMEKKTNSDFFYLQVNSKPSISHPENTPSNFTVELPNEIELKGEWQVALAYTELPPTKPYFKRRKKVFLKNDVSPITYSFSLMYIDVYTRKVVQKNRITFDSNGVLPYEGFLSTLQASAGEDIQIYVDENETPSIKLNKQDVICYLFISPQKVRDFIFPNIDENTGIVKANSTEIYQKYGHENEEEFKEASTFHGYANFDDIPCIEIRGRPGNPSPHTKFFFTLSEYYSNEIQKEEASKSSEDTYPQNNEDSEGKNSAEEKRLLQIFEKNYRVKRNIQQRPTWMFIYSDFVKPSLIADCYSNVLKLLPYKQRYKSKGTLFYTFTPLDFFTVNKDSLKTITFELRTHAGEIHNFRNSEENTSLTLYFKKVE